MLSLLSTVKAKVVAGAMVAMLTALGIMYWMYQNANDNLIDVTSKLTAAQAAITTLEATNKTLKDDAIIKNTLNLKLVDELSTIRSDYKQWSEQLNTQIDDLIDKQRESSVMVVNQTKYLKETYIEQVTNVVMDSLWSNYCKLYKKCNEGTQP